MDLIKLMNSANQSFTGTLDDTLLNRLSSSLHCDNERHKSFWLKFEQALPSDQFIILKKWVQEFTIAIKGNQMIHPNLLKVYFACVQHFIQQNESIQSEKYDNCLKDLKSLIKTCLLFSTDPEIQHAIIDCCNDVLMCDSKIQQFYSQLFSDDIASLLIKLNSSSSIFTLKALNKLLSSILSIFYGHECRYELSMSMLHDLIDRREKWVYDIVVDFATKSIKLNNISLITDLLQIFELTIQEDIQSCNHLTDSIVQLLYFCNIAERFLSNSTLELIKKAQLSWSSSMRLSAFLKVKRRSIMDRSDISCDLELFSDLTKCELKVLFETNEFTESPLLNDICELLDSENFSNLFTVNQMESISSKFIQSCCITQLLPLLLRLHLTVDKKVNILEKYLSGQISWHYLSYFERLLNDILNSSQTSISISNILHNIKERMLEESHCLGFSERPVTLCCLSLSHLTIHLVKLTDYKHLFNCQENQLKSFIHNEQEQQYSCFYLAIANNMASLSLRENDVTRLQINCHVDLQRLQTLCNSCTQISSELKEHLTTAILYQLFLKRDPNSDDTKALNDCVMSIVMNSLFDYRLLVLSECITRGFIWISTQYIEEVENFEKELNLLIKLSQYLIDNDLFANEFVDCHLIDSTNSIINQEFLFCNDLKIVRDYFVNCNEFCFTCGENIESILSDILVAIEQPRSVDCIGD